jgi:hypothetical protein
MDPSSPKRREVQEQPLRGERYSSAEVNVSAASYLIAIAKVLKPERKIHCPISFWSQPPCCQQTLLASLVSVLTATALLV